jgi:adenine-specific DNA-methyltransferase
MKNTIEKLEGTSLNITTEKKNQLKSLFPSVFTESKNDNGELVESIDFEKLKAELGVFSDAYENRRERYNMDWPGKKESLRLIQTPSTATLKPSKEESVNFDTTENLFIEGDNLEVLKLLQKSYYGKVKMIYIDPPYNTGKEFIYPDNYSESLETYLQYAGLADKEGKKFSTNTANEGRFHTKWLNMMYPRLYLARNLLKEDGAIFISIDDNEVSNLRKICDEIFGEENFLTTFMWKRKKETSNDSKNVAIQGEYILSYAKSNAANFKNESLSEEYIQASYEKPNKEFPLGKWRPVPITVSKGLSGGGYEYSITTPKGNTHNRIWSYPEKSFFELKEKGLIYWGKDKSGIPQRVMYAHDSKGQPTTNYWDNTSSNKEGKKIILDLFGDNYFDTTKPLKLINRLLSLIIDDEDIILDFFSGSSTTAHAVMHHNSNDGCNNKFILIQLPEPCAKDSEAFKAGYKTIADIGKERIRRVINKINKEKEGKLDLDNSNQDLGFKVLKLDKSNFKQWQKLDPETSSEKIATQLELHIDHINPNASQEDLLYEILIKAGFMPTEKIETIQLANTPVFSIAEGGLLICLAKKITKELIHDVIKAEPMQFICLDSAFGSDDQFKINIVQTIKDYNMSREKHNQIEFKTI